MTITVDSIKSPIKSRLLEMIESKREFLNHGSFLETLGIKIEDTCLKLSECIETVEIELNFERLSKSASFDLILFKNKGIIGGYMNVNNRVIKKISLNSVFGCYVTELNRQAEA